MPTRSEIEKGAEKILSAWTGDMTPGGQVLIRLGNDIVYEKCFGYANMENHIPITKNSIFHIASVSKQFTVLSILLLQEQGLLSIDEDIRTYVSDLISFKESVTIRQLLNNVSGIRDQWELLFMRGIKINDSISMKDANTTLRMQKTLNFPPQEDYLYCNTGFHILAVITERVSHMTFPDFVREKIFLPLGMNHSCVRQSASQIIPNLAYSYQDEGCGSYFYNVLNYSLYGPTSVNTCASDLIKILDEYEYPKLFSKNTIKTVLTPAVLKNGSEIEYCGGMMTSRFHGMRVYEHGGADAAYRGHLFWIPEKKLKIVLLSNTTSYMTSVASRKLAALVLGLKEDSADASAESLHPCSKATEGIYATSPPDDPMLITIIKKKDTFFMHREYADTPLILQPDLSWRIGTLEEYLVFFDDHLEYRLSSKTIRLSAASSQFLQSCKICEGLYLQDETDCILTIKKKGDGFTISHPRYGTTTIYVTEKNHALFGFNPDFTMYLSAKKECITLNGYRAKNMICVRI